MKYKVKISERSYEVEIEDIHARPIIAYVDGQKFEVHPENGSKPEAREEASEFQTGCCRRTTCGPNRKQQ